MEKECLRDEQCNAKQRTRSDELKASKCEFRTFVKAIKWVEQKEEIGVGDIAEKSDIGLCKSRAKSSNKPRIPYNRSYRKEYEYNIYSNVKV